MRIRALLTILVSCCAAFGCETLPDQAATTKTRAEPEIRTGTRLPGNNSGMTGSVSKEDWQNQRSRQGGAGELFK